MDELSNNEDFEVRERVAMNPNTPPEILNKLSKDKDWEVRESVAMNPNTSSETLDELSEDEEWTIRNLVASNPNTSKETLDSMVQAGDILLSHEVDETTETTEITETFDVSDGQTTITAVIYVDGEGNKQVIPAPGTLYTGISYTNTDSFILGAKTFRITVSAS